MVVGSSSLLLWRRLVGAAVARVNSGRLLERLGYSYISFVEPASEPELVETRFSDVLPQLSALEAGGWRLYRHQLVALEALGAGCNVVLVSGTGSGKTEAWLLHFLRMNVAGEYRGLALYPTLALAHDQVKRINMYASAVGVKVLELDASRRAELEKRLGRRGLREEIASARLVVSNPAFVLHDVKRLVESPQRSLLEPFYRRLDFLVLDELDFYGPRSLALLDALVELLALYTTKRLQVVVLTATLANPEELAERLTGVTGRRTVVVRGKPFRVENRVYLVLGKNLEKLWREVRERARKVWDRLDPTVRRSLESLEEFKKKLYMVLAVLEAQGLDVPKPSVDPAELLEAYAEDEGVTLVFTPSIASAERLVRRLKEKLGELVAAHHHLVPKSVREEVEERARRGQVKVVVSPRTLSQGVDIGTVVRVVHLGLPEDVREYMQREGRKGRRRELGYTETIVIPYSRWDRELLAQGVDAFTEWLGMPLEKTIVNPRNRYRLLFTGLAKLLSPWLGRLSSLTEEEASVLEEAGVTVRGRVDEKRARSIWEKLNFYEYGPPHGVKRYLDTGEGELKPLEPIGWCDLVERFQVGCIDYSMDAVVVQVRRAPRSRMVTAVVEKPLHKLRPWEVEGLEEAIEEYRYIKTGWGEEPSLYRDLARGKLVTRVICLVYPPRKGFGLLRKVPNRVVWTLYSDKPRVVETGSGPVVVYERRNIYVPVNTAGEYRDYTYGVIFEAGEADDPTLLRVGLAFMVIAMRRVLGIPFETIMYSVEKLGDKKIVELHEPEAAGVLETLDWARLRRVVEEYKPSRLDTVLLLQVDEIAYTDLASMGMDWELARRAALRVIDLILSREKVRAVLAGRRIEIPRPSRANKLLALDIIAHDLEETRETPVPETLVALAVYDGDQVRAAADIYVKLPLARPPKSLLELEAWIEDQALYEDMKLVVYDKQAALEAAKQAHLKRLARLLEEAQETRTLLPRAGLPENTPLEHLAEALKAEGVEQPRLEEPLYEMARRGKVDKRVLDKVADYLAKRTKALYIAHLALQALAEEGQHQGTSTPPSLRS